MLEIKLHFQNTLRYPILTMTKNIQKNILELKLKTSRTKAPTTTIIGDRMIKKNFGGKLSRQLNKKHHVIVPSFVWAKARCMEDYIKPTVKLAPKTNNTPLQN